MMKPYIKFASVVSLLLVWLDAVHTATTTTPTTRTGSSTDETDKTCPVKLQKYTGPSQMAPVMEKSEMALLLLLGFGGFSLIVAFGYKALRKHVFHDEDKLDTVFDAGGQVSLTLTAVTVTSQLLWPSDFLLCPTLINKSGIGGSLWMVVGIVVDILLFPTLSIYLKTRAPGAKTFPQIAYARFGKSVHVLFCMVALLANVLVTASLILSGKTAMETLSRDTNNEFIFIVLAALFGSHNIAYARFNKSVHVLFCMVALLANVLVTASLILSGKTAMETLSRDTNNEFIFIVLAVLFGSYCLIGGLGATFYISYFNTALTFICQTIAYARFGKSVHVLFCMVALLANVLVTASLILSGKTAMETLSRDTNNEFIFIVLAVLFGSYCLIGGLGATFYISYFNTALTFISVTVYILSTSFYPKHDKEYLHSLRSMHEEVACIEGPKDNYDRSYLTFRSGSGLIYGTVMLFMATSISFCDQANWQSRVAAKPAQGVVGFFFAAYMFFVIPTTLSFPITMSYLSMSAQNGTHLLSDDELASGYITPFVMSALLGPTGGYLLLTMLMMALMSTGSGEVMSISSIIVYDIYKTYINPFRENLKPTSCVLCGKDKFTSLELSTNEASNADDVCTCPSVVGCTACEEDHEARKSAKHFDVVYKCPHHGRYRHYEDGLLRYKSWCMIWVVVAIVPLGSIISESGMNVSWATLSITTIMSSFLMPLFLTIAWSKATAKGLISGSVCGLIVAVAAMLIVGSTYEGGLNNFYANTSQDYTLLISMLLGLFISGTLSIVVSLCTHNIKSEADVEKEWTKTINIDNPLNPFRLLYSEELKEINAGPVITSVTMDRVFRTAKRVAYIGGLASLVLFLVVVPAVTLSIPVLSAAQFEAWQRTLQVWCFIGTCVVVVAPPVEEGRQIWKRMRENWQEQDLKLKEKSSKTLEEESMASYVTVVKS